MLQNKPFFKINVVSVFLFVLSGCITGSPVVNTSPPFVDINETDIPHSNVRTDSYDLENNNLLRFFEVDGKTAALMPNLLDGKLVAGLQQLYLMPGDRKIKVWCYSNRSNVAYKIAAEIKWKLEKYASYYVRCRFDINEGRGVFFVLDDLSGKYINYEIVQWLNPRDISLHNL